MLSCEAVLLVEVWQLSTPAAIQRKSQDDLGTAEQRPARRPRIPKAPVAGDDTKQDARSKRRKVHGDFHHEGHMYASSLVSTASALLSKEC